MNIRRRASTMVAWEYDAIGRPIVFGLNMTRFILASSSPAAFTKRTIEPSNGRTLLLLPLATLRLLFLGRIPFRHDAVEEAGGLEEVREPAIDGHLHDDLDHFPLRGAGPDRRFDVRLELGQGGHRGAGGHGAQLAGLLVDDLAVVHTAIDVALEHLAELGIPPLELLENLLCVPAGEEHGAPPQRRRVGLTLEGRHDSSFCRVPYLPPRRASATIFRGSNRLISSTWVLV